MTRNAAIIGATALPVGKYQTAAGEPLHVLEHEVLGTLIMEAVRKAGIDKSEVDALIFCNPRPYTDQKYFATFMANYLRIACRSSVCELLGNGMTGGLAFDKTVDEIVLGRARVALVLGVNFETAVPRAAHANNSIKHTGDVDFHAPFGFTPISWYAMDATRYMHEFGATRADLASVAVKNRYHASLNPVAQFRKPITLDEVLAQRPIVEPLGLYEVPPRSDGAVCLVLAEENVAAATGKPYARVRGRGFFHEGAHQISEVPNDMTAFVSAATAGRAAFEEAGIGASDLDFAEIYAPCTIVEVLVSEALGLCDRGGGAKSSVDGETTLGGRIPICTSGGNTSRGHPPLVTPLYNLVEVHEQLCGSAGERQVKDAELAAACCELGNYNAALVHVLERAQ